MPPMLIPAARPFKYEPRIDDMFEDMIEQGHFATEEEQMRFFTRYCRYYEEMKTKYGDQVYQAQWNAEYKIYREYFGDDATVESFGCPEPSPMTPVQIEDNRRHIVEDPADAPPSWIAKANEESAARAQAQNAAKTGIETREAERHAHATQPKEAERHAPVIRPIEAERHALEIRPKPKGSAERHAHATQPKGAAERHAHAAPPKGAAERHAHAAQPKEVERSALASGEKKPRLGYGRLIKSTDIAGHDSTANEGASSSYSQALQRPAPVAPEVDASGEEWMTVGPQPRGPRNPFKGVRLALPMANNMPRFSAVTTAKYGRLAFIGKDGRNLEQVQSMFNVNLCSHYLDDDQTAVCVWAEPRFKHAMTEGVKKELDTVHNILKDWVRTRRNDCPDQAEEFDFFVSDWMARRNKEDADKRSVKVTRRYPYPRGPRPEPNKGKGKHVGHPVPDYKGVLYDYHPKFGQREPGAATKPAILHKNPSPGDLMRQVKVEETKESQQARKQTKLLDSAQKKLDEVVKEARKAEEALGRNETPEETQRRREGEAAKLKSQTRDWYEMDEEARHEEDESNRACREKLIGICSFVVEVEAKKLHASMTQAQILRKAMDSRRTKMLALGFTDEEIDVLLNSQSFMESDDKTYEALIEQRKRASKIEGTATGKTKSLKITEPSSKNEGKVQTADQAIKKEGIDSKKAGPSNAASSTQATKPEKKK
ncbi:uncharacterized protein BP5553_05682 [Venustampulla echinocandica]|uniref:Uncharacterized protein n=1 Tax=Venustampulla echinocandica TaxID=2656787 RepID=A0A370TLC5_9HELO|nr:uncharacterized protein BP5553_05682 [Venustampulla echinocandica]RDL36330.1 hypothetical protein BP5553_05682 [Venustampulla echinocandica]